MTLHIGPSAVDASLQFVDVRDLGTIDSLAKHTLHSVVNRMTADFFNNFVVSQ